MLTHDQVWSGVDQLAADSGLSASGLAKVAGLDATTFSRSKRISRSGRKRWPSMESLAKALAATGKEFGDLIANASRQPNQRLLPLLPLNGLNDRHFDVAGFPESRHWTSVAFSDAVSDCIYALEICGESCLPVYRDGDLIIVSPAREIRHGDRVVVKVSGEVTVKLLTRKSNMLIGLRPVGLNGGELIVAIRDVEWVARIIWASQ